MLTDLKFLEPHIPRLPPELRSQLMQMQTPDGLTFAQHYDNLCAWINDGGRAWRLGIDQLRAVSPLNPMIWSDDLTKTVLDHISAEWSNVSAVVTTMATLLSNMRMSISTPQLAHSMQLVWLGTAIESMANYALALPAAEPKPEPKPPTPQTKQSEQTKKVGKK